MSTFLNDVLERIGSFLDMPPPTDPQYQHPGFHERMALQASVQDIRKAYLAGKLSAGMAASYMEGAITRSPLKNRAIEAQACMSLWMDEYANGQHLTDYANRYINQSLRLVPENKRLEAVMSVMTFWQREYESGTTRNYEDNKRYIPAHMCGCIAALPENDRSRPAQAYVSFWIKQNKEKTVSVSSLDPVSQAARVLHFLAQPEKQQIAKQLLAFCETEYRAQRLSADEAVSRKRSIVRALPAEDRPSHGLDDLTSFCYELHHKKELETALIASAVRKALELYPTLPSDKARVFIDFCYMHSPSASANPNRLSALTAASHMRYAVSSLSDGIESRNIIADKIIPLRKEAYRAGEYKSAYDAAIDMAKDIDVDSLPGVTRAAIARDLASFWKEEYRNGAISHHVATQALQEIVRVIPVHERDDLVKNLVAFCQAEHNAKAFPDDGARASDLRSVFRRIQNALPPSGYDDPAGQFSVSAPLGRSGDICMIFRGASDTYVALGAECLPGPLVIPLKEAAGRLRAVYPNDNDPHRQQYRKFGIG